MHLVVRRAEALDRQVVDADENEAASDQPIGGVSREAYKVGVEFVVVPEAAIWGLQEKAGCSIRDHCRLEVMSVNVTLLGQLDDLSRSDESLERHRFDSRAAVEEVVGRVDVGTGVRPEGESSDVSGVAAPDLLEVIELRAGLAGVGGHAGPEWNGHVVNRHGLSPPFCTVIILVTAGACYLFEPEVKAMAEPRKLSEEEVQTELAKLEGWELRDGRLRKQFTFRTFLRAIAFVNSVAYVAESVGHHPDITINYNKVTLRIITHSEGAITDRDFGLVAEIERRLTTKLMIQPEGEGQAALRGK